MGSSRSAAWCDRPIHIRLKPHRPMPTKRRAAIARCANSIIARIALTDRATAPTSFGTMAAKSLMPPLPRAAADRALGSAGGPGSRPYDHRPVDRRPSARPSVQRRFAATRPITWVRTHVRATWAASSTGLRIDVFAAPRRLASCRPLCARLRTDHWSRRSRPLRRHGLDLVLTDRAATHTLDAFHERSLCGDRTLLGSRGIVRQRARRSLIGFSRRGFV